MRHRLAGLMLSLMAFASCPWATELRSGNEFLTPSLQALQADADANPVTLWLQRGRERWEADCTRCHASLDQVASAAARYPQLAPKPRAGLINLEDQIVSCRQRTGAARAAIEDPETLALSAWLHQSARGQPIAVKAPVNDEASATRWREELAQGAALYTTRMGRMNLACVHCHDAKVGANLRAEVISPGHPSGFPIYRMSWQGLGSIDRRLRACYSGVQASVPPAGSVELRQLELFLKARAEGMGVEGPSIRR